MLSLGTLFMTNVNADTLNIAVASNFSQPAKELADQFQKKTGSSVIISTGATGMLFNQIKNGAPYAILLAADETTVQKLIQEGYGIESSTFTYAIGQLVLWSPQKSLVDSKGHILFTGKFAHLAIANPKLAPYGLAAQAVIARLKLANSLQDKIVIGENINATYQYVISGNADLGFVALSQVYRNGKITSGSAWIIESNLYSPIKQDAVVTKASKDNKLAQQFMLFLKSSEARKIIHEYGYK